MIYREVLTAIPSDDFLLAADRTFQTAESIRSISSIEQKTITAEFSALAGLSWVVQVDKLLKFKKRYGKQLAVGISRFNLALKEYFDGLEEAYMLDDDTHQTRQWLSNLQRRPTYAFLRSYLYQQAVEARMDGLDDDLEAEVITAEEVAMTEEYPAFADFADLLEDRLLDEGVDDEEAYNINNGAILAAVVVRELIEMRQLPHELQIASGF